MKLLGKVFCISCDGVCIRCVFVLLIGMFVDEAAVGVQAPDVPVVRCGVCNDVSCMLSLFGGGIASTVCASVWKATINGVLTLIVDGFSNVTKDKFVWVGKCSVRSVCALSADVDGFGVEVDSVITSSSSMSSSVRLIRSGVICSSLVRCILSSVTEESQEVSIFLRFVRCGNVMFMISVVVTEVLLVIVSAMCGVSSVCCVVSGGWSQSMLG